MSLHSKEAGRTLLCLRTNIRGHFGHKKRSLKASLKTDIKVKVQPNCIRVIFYFHCSILRKGESGPPDWQESIWEKSCWRIRMGSWVTDGLGSGAWSISTIWLVAENELWTLIKINVDTVLSCLLFVCLNHFSCYTYSFLFMMTCGLTERNHV